MKKAALVLLCVVFLVSCILLPPAAAVEVGGQTVIFTIVNDFYLKSQGQTEGMDSYGEMVDLLLAEFADIL